MGLCSVPSNLAVREQRKHKEKYLICVAMQHQYRVLVAGMAAASTTPRCSSVQQPAVAPLCWTSAASCGSLRCSYGVRARRRPCGVGKRTQHLLQAPARASQRMWFEVKRAEVEEDVESVRHGATSRAAYCVTALLYWHTCL